MNAEFAMAGDMISEEKGWQKKITKQQGHGDLCPIKELPYVPLGSAWDALAREAS
jgi:hypothetical protein